MKNLILLSLFILFPASLFGYTVYYEETVPCYEEVVYHSRPVVERVVHRPAPSRRVVYDYVDYDYVEYVEPAYAPLPFSFGLNFFFD